MRNTITLLLALCLCCSSATTTLPSNSVKTATHLRRRRLAKGGEICLDLGPRRGGLQSMEVSADVKKFYKYDSVEQGSCSQEGEKKLKKRRQKSLERMERYCKQINSKKVTILGPEIIKKWMKEEVEASFGPCENEDEIIIIQEI